MKKADLLKRELEEASQLEDRAERALAITAVIQKALSPYHLYPILVGGAAVEIYTRGLYASGDIDYVLPTVDKVKKTMKMLGFKKEGRLFIHPKFELIIEFPSNTLEKGESYEIIEYNGVPIRIIAREDLLIDRLNAFKWGGASIEIQNILIMLDSISTPTKEIKYKAKKHDVSDALKDLWCLRKKFKNKSLSPEERSAYIEKIIKKFKCEL